MDAVDTSRDGQAGRSSGSPGPKVLKASIGGQPFRYPLAVEILASRLLGTGLDLSRRSAVGGKLVTTARRLMHGRGSE